MKFAGWWRARRRVKEMARLRHKHHQPPSGLGRGQWIVPPAGRDGEGEGEHETGESPQPRQASEIARKLKMLGNSIRDARARLPRRRRAEKRR